MADKDASPGPGPNQGGDAAPQREAMAELSRDEREMLIEFATRLRERPVRNAVAREALDRAAAELVKVARQPGADRSS